MLKLLRTVYSVSFCVGSSRLTEPQIKVMVGLLQWHCDKTMVKLKIVKLTNVTSFRDLQNLMPLIKTDPFSILRKSMGIGP